MSGLNIDQKVSSDTVYIVFDVESINPNPVKYPDATFAIGFTTIVDDQNDDADDLFISLPFDSVHFDEDTKQFWSKHKEVFDEIVSRTTHKSRKDVVEDIVAYFDMISAKYPGKKIVLGTDDESDFFHLNTMFCHEDYKPARFYTSLSRSFGSERIIEDEILVDHRVLEWKPYRFNHTHNPLHDAKHLADKYTRWLEYNKIR